MRIAIDCRMKYGVGTILKNIVPLIACSVDHLILLGDDSEIRKWNFTSANYSVIPFKYRIYSPQEQFFFPRDLLSNVDVYHSPHFNIPLRKSKRAKIVTTINDLIHLSNVLPMNMIYKAYARFLLKQAVTRSTQLITISSFSKQEILKYFDVPENKISVAYCGVDNNIFKPREKAAFEVLSDKLNLRSKYILITGSLRPHKNLSNLIRSFGLLVKNHQIPHKLVIVGEDRGFRINPREMPIDSALRKKMLYTGYLTEEELAILYSFCDVFVFPSVYEGFGLPPLEAMACGAPVIASERTSLPEVLGEAGLLVDPLNIDHIASAILRVLINGEYRNKMKEMSLEQSKKFSWLESAIVYLESYRRALNI